MILAVGCSVELEGRTDVQSATAADALELMRRAPPPAVLLGRDAVADPAWEAVCTAQTALIAVVDDMREIATLPPWIDDVVLSTVPRDWITARVELALRRITAATDSRARAIGIVRAFLRSSTIACAMIAPDGTVRAASPPFRAMWGETDMAPPELRDAVADGGNVEVTLPDDRVIRRQCTDVFANGTRIGTLHICEDLTGRRRLEDTVRRSETMSAIGAVVSGVAHDVRNRLFGLSATLEAFQVHARGNVEMAPFFETLEEEMGLLERQLAELIDYGRSAALQLGPGSLQHAMRDALTASHDLAMRTRTQIDARVSPALPELVFDHRRIVQLLHNLLVNAIQHAPGGTVVAAIEASQREGRRVALIRISDDGRGFPPDEIERVFEPFFTRRSGGVGLGLAIVKRIAEAHGGRVRAVNRPEGGAEITVAIPFASCE